jgi:capsular polysaccharide export protein
VPVTCLGAPFYAGWGLTRDLGPVPARRTARPSLAALAHAVLIAYPRYRDPVSGLPCTAETAAERLASDTLPAAPAGLRLLSRMQRIVRPLAPLWRTAQARQ